MTLNLTKISATQEHLDCMNDLKAALGKHRDLDAIEMLVIVSQLVGNLTALQDQRKYTAEEVMELVAGNIEIGNLMTVQTILGQTEGQA